MQQLVGREQLFAAATTALETSHTGVVLVGEAGAGKTCLAAAMLRSCSAAGRPTGEVSVAPDSVTPPLLSAAHIDSNEPTTYLLDDVDGMSDATVAAYIGAAQRGAAKLIVTLRAGSIMPPLIERALVVGDMARVECLPLDIVGTADMIAHVAGGTATADTVKTVHTVTQGNPLYIRELVTAAIELGTLRRSPAGISLDEVPTASNRLTDLLAYRLRTLTDEDRHALHRIALVGSPSHAEMCRFTTDEVLEKLDTRGLIRAEQRGKALHFEMAHPLHAEVIQQLESAIRARLIRQEHAEYLRERGDLTAHDVVRLATWSLDGICEVSPTEMHAAAITAATTGNTQLTARLGASVYENDPTIDNATFLGYQLASGTDLDAFRHHARCWEHLATSDSERAQRESLYTQTLFWKAADGTMIDRLVAGFDTWQPGATRTMMQVAAMLLLTSSGRIDEAVSLDGEIVAPGPDVVELLRKSALAQCLNEQGRPCTAATLAAEGLDACSELSPALTADAAAGFTKILLNALADSGQFDAHDTLIARQQRLWAAGGRTVNRATAQLAIAHGWYLRGEFQQAQLMCAESRFELEWTVSPAQVRWARITEALAAAENNELDAARDQLDALDRLPDHPAKIHTHREYQARAWIAHHEEAGNLAHRWLHEGVERCWELGSVLGVLECVHLMARLGGCGHAAQHLARIDEHEIEGALHLARIAHIRAVADGSSAALEACVGKFDALGMAHVAAECALEAARLAGSSAEARRLAQLAHERGSTPQGTLKAAFDQAELSPRERQVALLAVRGMTSKQIAEHLGTSRRTVDHQLGAAYTKLRVNGRTGLLDLVG